MKQFIASVAAATIIVGTAFVATSFAHPEPKPNKKAAEWASDCVYAAMAAGYTGTAADLGQFCVEAITVVVNADY